MASETPKTPAASKAKEPAKVFDVAKPGETAASNTSRPVIVGHTSTIKQDPMVVEADTKSEPAETTKPGPKNEAPTINPVSAGIEEPEKTQEPDSETNADQESSISSDSAVVDVLAGDITTKKESEKLAEAEIKKNEEINKFIASKKYFVHTKTAPGKRNAQWIIALMIVAIVGAAWFILLGPGKDMWSKKAEVSSSTPAQQAPIASQTKVPATTNLAQYSNPAFGLSFSYPKDWKAEVGKDSDRKSVDTITLSGPSEKLKLAREDGQVDVEAYVRVKIYIENTTDLKLYPSSAYGLSLCKSETITNGAGVYKLAITGASTVNPNRALLTSQDCSKSPPYTIGDQLQFAAKKNTYSIKAEYILSDEYLLKSGVTNPKDVLLSQMTGIQLSEANFKAGDGYKQFKSLAQSLKNL